MASLQRQQQQSASPVAPALDRVEGAVALVRSRKSEERLRLANKALREVLGHMAGRVGSAVQEEAARIRADRAKAGGEGRERVPDWLGSKKKISQPRQHLIAPPVPHCLIFDNDHPQTKKTQPQAGMDSSSLTAEEEEEEEAAVTTVPLPSSRLRGDRAEEDAERGAALQTMDLFDGLIASIENARPPPAHTRTHSLG